MVFKLVDGLVEVNEAVDAGQPVRDMMAMQRKMEILSWLRQRLNGGLISKQEMQSRIEQLEANMDKLMSPDEARRFTMSIGIMQVSDAVIVSPTMADKDKTKNLEESVSGFLTMKGDNLLFIAEKSERVDQEVRH